MSRLFSFAYEVRERNKSFLSDATMATETSRNPETGQVPVPRVQEVRTLPRREDSASHQASGGCTGVGIRGQQSDITLLLVS